MIKNLTEYIEQLIASDELWRFYKSKEWVALKNKVLKENHYECAECKKRGKITRYDVDAEGRKKLLSTVHHINHVRSHPELALTKDNLIPVCKACHNKLHPEKRSRARNFEGFTNKERW